MRVKAVIIGFIMTLLFIAIGFFLYSQNVQQTKSTVEISHQQNSVTDRPKTKHSRFSRDATAKTSEAFYQFIIDNNIFRPLGWVPPIKQPDYILIGTAVSQNAAASKAFVVERRSNRFHIVKVGDTIDESRVKEIQANQVTLQAADKSIILRGGKLQFF